MKTAVALMVVLAVFSPAGGQTYTISPVAGGGLPEGIPALSASLSYVHGVATDGLGNVYVSLWEYHVVVRRDSAGMLTRVAGTGTYGYSGDNGPATSAQLAHPYGIAIDSAGNLYIADFGNHSVRKVTNGVITTVAGTGVGGYSGNNGPATSAQLSGPQGVAVDSAGNLYISEYYTNSIRKVTNGVITTVAGNGTRGYSGDDGAASSAQLYDPEGIAVDSTGNLYIADHGNHRIRKVANGVITSVAGNGVGGYNGDNRPATSAQVFQPSGVAVDSAGNLYIAEGGNNRVRKITNGVITTVAGNPTSAYGGDGGPATDAQLNQPKGVAVDSAGNLYIADFGNLRIREVSDGIITTVAGDGKQGYRGENGPATNAQLNRPTSVAIDSSGNLYIADDGNHSIRKVANGVITTVTGNGTGGYNGDDGLATSAQLFDPQGIAVDSAGNLYIADSVNNRIRKVTNGVITTVAGNGSQGYSGDNGPATSAQFHYPIAVAIDSAGNLYVADYHNHRIRKVTNGVITTIAGDGTQGYSGDNGPATSAQLYQPWGLAIDSAGSLYIADYGCHCIRKVANGVITTVAGNGVPGYSGDNGPATNAQLTAPQSVAVDSAGNLYIADTVNHRIRKVTNGVITTIAGNGAYAYGGDNGPATSAQLSWTSGVAVDALGNVYLADYTSHRVQVLTPRAPTCSYAVSTTDLGVVAAGGSLALSIQTDSNCSWAITDLPAWLTVSGNSQGTGPAHATLIASYNPDGPRTGSVAVGSLSVPVRQLDSSACAGSTSCAIRVLTHVAFGGEWTTDLVALSAGANPGSFSISFHGDSGAAVPLPFSGGLGNLSTLADTVPAQGRKDYEAGNAAGTVQAGWGLVTADDSLAVHAVFRRHTADGKFYEAAVPTSEGYSRFIVPFDATTFAPTGAEMYTGFAIANLNPSAAAHVVCTARDESGAIVPDAVSIPALNPLGHYTGFAFPALAGKRGTFDCVADTLVSALALRTIGGDAISTLPVIVK